MIHETGNKNAWRDHIRRQRARMAATSNDTIIANHDQSIDFLVDGVNGVTILSSTGDTLTLTPDESGCVSIETQQGVFSFEFMPSGNVALSFRPAVREAQPVAPEPRRWTFEEVWGEAIDGLLED